MVYDAHLELTVDDLFIEVPDLLDKNKIFLKLESMSMTGPSKIKAALHMLSQMEQEGALKPGMTVIESSSGNIGLALSMACAVKGYPFICVTDPNISPQTARLIEAYDASLITVCQRDINGSFRGTRIALIRSMLETDKALVWTSQYENEKNVDANCFSTGPEILHHFARPDFVFIDASTTGTLGGVSRYLREYSPETKIIAVDRLGSKTLGAPSGTRHIPGLGTDQAPPVRQYSDFDDIVMIDEQNAVTICRRLAQRGLLIGEPSGMVLTGIVEMKNMLPDDACIVAISPDMGDG